ncbi:NAD(P)-binding protein [Aspergillus pseudoustus]|uniref:NAD(P)-binding protein n=1 Tax=Aspergillus pseudoustus TaxID=1810923 RepID=A0ABR4KI36_9EURO
MSKILTVVGATGAQGGSVVSSALKSGAYKVRGITRNVKSAAAQALAAQGVEMVAADANDLASLVKAFEGSHAIFVVTDFFASFATHGVEETVAIESTQGINCAKAASKTATLEHYIWSTLPDNQKISGGKYSVPHFESKVKVDEYIRRDKALLSKTTFLFITYYATNILMPMFTPTFFKPAGKHVQLLPMAEDAPITTLGATTINTGTYVLAILKQPHLTLPARTVLAETETRTAKDVVKLWSEVSGTPAEFASISLDHYDNLWPKWGREVGLMLQFWDYARERSWIAEDTVLKKEDLGISGLVGMKEVFAGIDWATV